MVDEGLPIDLLQRLEIVTLTTPEAEATAATMVTGGAENAPLTHLSRTIDELLFEGLIALVAVRGHGTHPLLDLLGFQLFVPVAMPGRVFRMCVEVSLEIIHLITSPYQYRDTDNRR